MSGEGIRVCVEVYKVLSLRKALSHHLPFLLSSSCSPLLLPAKEGSSACFPYRSCLCLFSLLQVSSYSPLCLFFEYLWHSFDCQRFRFWLGPTFVFHSHVSGWNSCSLAVFQWPHLSLRSFPSSLGVCLLWKASHLCLFFMDWFFPW